MTTKDRNWNWLVAIGFEKSPEWFAWDWHASPTIAAAHKELAAATRDAERPAHFNAFGGLRVGIFAVVPDSFEDVEAVIKSLNEGGGGLSSVRALKYFSCSKEI